MTRVVVLRPEPGASATAGLAIRLRLEPVTLPLFAIEPCRWRAPAVENFDAVMLTSANAAQHGGAALMRYRALPLYAVGAATASAARSAGFGMVIEAGPDVAQLVFLVRADGHARILDLGGRDRTSVDTGSLHVTRRIVYAAEPIAVDEARLGRLADEQAIFLLHSARAAERLATLVEPACTQVAAISAKALGSAIWSSHAIAATPDDRALLAAAAWLCDQQAV